MAEISGGRLFAKALKQEGVEYVFTLNGGHIYNLYEGCDEEGIKLIDFRHEQVAAHAAEGWAKVTGKPGVAIVTAGPGVTDAVTGVANAFQAPSADFSHVPSRSKREDNHLIVTSRRSTNQARRKHG